MEVLGTWIDRYIYKIRNGKGNTGHKSLLNFGSIPPGTGPFAPDSQMTTRRNRRTFFQTSHDYDGSLASTQRLYILSVHMCDLLLCASAHTEWRWVHRETHTLFLKMHGIG